MTKDLLTQLKQPFEPKFLKWRVGATSKDKTKGIALAYLDAREVMKRLDEVCGIDGWQAKYIPVEGGLICELSIKIGDNWITKSNTADNTKVAPIKGGASDALKRAAVLFGVGRYLYYLPNKWVKLDAYKNLTEIPALPDWAKPDIFDTTDWEKEAEESEDVGVGADEEALYTVSDIEDKSRLKAIANAAIKR